MALMSSVISPQKKYLFLPVLIVALTMLTQHASAQKKTKIKLINAGELIGKTIDKAEMNIFVRDVAFKHDSTYLYCDSAILNPAQNNLHAYGNVHIFVSDTLNLYSDVLFYEGDKRMATMTGHVKLVDNDATLTTDRLIYDRIIKVAYYTTGGKIVNEKNVLTSRQGYYHTESKDLFFKENVVFDNEEYHMVSDSMRYNTNTEIAHITGATTITGEDEMLYAEAGWYDSRLDRARLKEHPHIWYNEQYLSGDSIYYDKNAGIGEAFGNVLIKDTLQDMIITGHYADYRKGKGYAYATDSACAILIDVADSLYLHADTLLLTFDTLQGPETLFAFYHTKFYKTSIQGMCDSLVYSFSDSTILMNGLPVLWTQDNQLTADRIKIFSSNQQVDSMQMINSAFIISVDEYGEDQYNQIKGRDMTGYFENNELYRIDVFGNSQTIYFVREEDGALIGINQAVAGNMTIRVGERNVTDIYYYDKPDAHLIPEAQFPKQELKLKNFNWLGQHRPLNKNDIFIWRTDTPALKH